MKRIILGLLAVMMLASCSRERDPQTYDNPKIGLRITYPGTWRVAKKELLGDAIDLVGEKVKTISEDTLDEAREMTSNIILTLVKPYRVDGVDRNPNINVLVLDIPESEWGDVDMDSVVREQIEETKSSAFPGAKVTINDFPLPGYPEIHNYSLRIPLHDRTATVYHYAYWRPPYLVQIGFTFSHPGVEQEVKGIITSMRIKASNKPDAGDG
ncbi:MAG: membrane lipoprotein lipid attachment site-containing protein [Phycisphaerae bacterium]|jgi:hypothetical protein|nr:membrane lipoprotein lipid attachment site-containing protein [Phycisphaerae bacterium]